MAPQNIDDGSIIKLDKVYTVLKGLEYNDPLARAAISVMDQWWRKTDEEVVCNLIVALLKDNQRLREQLMAARISAPIEATIIRVKDLNPNQEKMPF